MTWWEVEPLAKFGSPVRRASWSAVRSMVFSAGAGTERAVLVQRIGATESVVTTADFTAADFTADDWQPA